MLQVSIYTLLFCSEAEAEPVMPDGCVHFANSDSLPVQVTGSNNSVESCIVRARATAW
jgi:hypothetical protein